MGVLTTSTLLSAYPHIRAPCYYRQFVPLLSLISIIIICAAGEGRMSFDWGKTQWRRQTEHARKHSISLARQTGLWGSYSTPGSTPRRLRPAAPVFLDSRAATG